MPTPPSVPPASPKTFRAGTLVYSAQGLRLVFAWLLAGEVIFTLIDMLEPKVLPVLLKVHGASDKEIGVIVGSFNAILQLVIMAPLGYWSDRVAHTLGSPDSGALLDDPVCHPVSRRHALCTGDRRLAARLAGRAGHSGLCPARVALPERPDLHQIKPKTSGLDS
jgi:hypothetical protein